MDPRYFAHALNAATIRSVLYSCSQCEGENKMGFIFEEALDGTGISNASARADVAGLHWKDTSSPRFPASCNLVDYTSSAVLGRAGSGLGLQASRLLVVEQQDIYKDTTDALARSPFSLFSKSQNVVLSVSSVATLRVASTSTITRMKTI